MSLRLSSLLRHCAGVAAFSLALTHAQAQSPSSMPYGPTMPNVSSSVPASAGSSNADTGIGASTGEVPGFQEFVYPGGLYGGAFHPFSRHAFSGPGYYGFFRRYWGYGSYGPSYRMESEGRPTCLGSEQLYTATRACLGNSKHGKIISYPTHNQGISNFAAPAESPANVARVQLVVPENAEVLVEGVKTAATGTLRDFVTPPLPPDENMLYTIVVRTAGSDGKAVEDARTVRIRANDQLRLDFTNPVKILRPDERIQE
jgi:uncharacterized protein (TIGR03000 family)